MKVHSLLFPGVANIATNSISIQVTVGRRGAVGGSVRNSSCDTVEISRSTLLKRNQIRACSRRASASQRVRGNAPQQLIDVAGIVEDVCNQQSWHTVLTNNRTLLENTVSYRPSKNVSVMLRLA
jgi:hypothetical protein